MPQDEFTGVVVAAGRASRFGDVLPKQFHDLAGRTVLQRSVQALCAASGVRGVIVVLSAEELSGTRGAEVRAWTGVLDVVAGGATRAASVRRGLAAAGSTPYVLIHDAARPLVTRALVEAVLEATRRHGAALPALSVADTVKEVDLKDRVLRTVPREQLRLAQTPQGARTDWLIEALEQAERQGVPVTDEAVALELAGRTVAVVAGEAANRKITTPDDLEQARRRHDTGAGPLRVGTGFDIHKLGADRPLVLGGVTFPGESGLIGHSDADVVLHAAMDAVLGACAMGDIGELFPPDDDEWEGADSRDLSRRVAERVRAAGWRLINVDIMLLAETPRIRDRRLEMIDAIAACFGVEPSQVGLKATTLEQLGALGRREGIACQAVALVERQ